MSKRPAIIIFSITLFWIVFLIQGLPLGDLDDWDHILFAQDASWKTLLENIFRPWSASPFWYGQGSFFDHAIHERVIPTFLLKSISSLFGLHSFALFFLYKALFFAGTCTLLFLLLRRMTRSNTFAFCGVLFFALIPVHYFHVLWISDPVTIVHFFVLAGLWAYLKILANVESKGSFQHFIFKCLALLIIGWIGMKSKSPALILPLIVGMHVIWQMQSWKGQRLKWTCLLAVCA